MYAHVHYNLCNSNTVLARTVLIAANAPYVHCVATVSLKLIMASFEKKCLHAYSEDLCWRIVLKKEALGYGNAVIAQNLNINQSTVYRILQ